MRNQRKELTARSHSLAHRCKFHEPSFQKILIASAILHVLLVSLVAVPLTSRQKELRSYFVNIVGPIETMEPQAETAPAAETGAKTVQKSEADVSLKPAERTAKEIERLRAIEKLSAIKKLREKTQNVKVIAKKDTARHTQKGIYGTGTGSFDSYYRVVTEKIWQQWAYPELKTSGLETVISIKIAVDGRIISQKIEKTSGDILFDRSAMKAISKSSPLPPPPMEMEIGVRFYL